MTNDPVPSGKGRSSGGWVIAVFLLIVLVFGIAGLHKAGYAVLTGGGNRVDTQTGMMMLSCTYFTGTDTVINHTLRKAGGAANQVRCPIVSKLNPMPNAN